MSNLWKSLKELVGVSKVDDEELKRSQYSLVSCGELTNDTLQLWMGLPDEVKNDPSLAPLKLLYEKEYGSDSVSKKAAGSKKRLPSVNSAPVISPSLQVLAQDIELLETKNGDVLDLNNEEEAEGGNVEKNLRKGVSKISMNKKTQKYSSAKYYTKMSVLLACWLTFTAAFISYNEKVDVTRLTSIAPGEVKNYTLHPPYSEVRIAIKLRGPFLTEHAQIKAGDSSHKMQVVLQRLAMENGSRFSVVEESLPWVILLQDYHELDFTQGEIRSTILHLTSMLNATEYVYNLHMSTTSNQTTPVLMGIQVDPLQPSTGVVYAIVLLTGLYVLIIFEVINRTMAAITVATMSIATLAMAGERPSLPEIISWLDEETLLLLFSMMLLVAIMAETGIFDFLAVFTFEVTKGKLWPLIYLLCAITAVLSTFLDNVTTVLLMSPVTIRLCEVMELDPVPILMLMAIYSNIGGTATPVGDPPNVIVASNKAVIQSGVNFTNFTAHMALGIVLVCIQTSIQIRIMFRNTNKLRLSVPREIQDITHQIKIWRRAADSLPHLSKDVHIVRDRLERKISKLSDQLTCMVKESKTRACPRDTFNTTLQELKAKYKIRDKVLLVKSSVAITFVVVVFFLHAIPELNRMSLSWTALLGAILLLILADREDLEPVLHKVEWSTLLFFAALFVLMEALSKLGLILYIGGLMEHLILNVGEDARLAVSLMLILWVSGMISAFVDNIPLTTMMVRVVVAIGSNPHLNLPMQPLIWALLCGACLGGNGTLIGASANVVCAGVAELHGYRITFGRFFKVGFPIMIGHLVMASIYLLICHCVFAWH